MDQIPVASRTAEAQHADLQFSAGIGQWIDGAPGQDQSHRHFDGRKTGVEMVEPAPDDGRFDALGMGAEALMVPVAPFQGAVDEEPADGLGTVFQVCADSGRPWPSTCGRTFSASKCAVRRICQLREFSNIIHAFAPSGGVPLRSWGMKRNSLFSMARTLDVDGSYVARILKLTTLAPDIVEALINGEEPNGLSLAKLTQTFPEDWAEQRRQFGFATD